MQFVMYNGKLSIYQHSFLPRDAMHKRGLCHHAASVCVSVCVSVRHVPELCRNG